MKLRYPSYYENFKCIASRCEDTCCAGWEIDIDDESYEYYMGVEGEFGEKLRSRIKEYDSEEADVYENHGFVLGEDRRCPFLDENNLCDIYKELGEEALCYVCTFTPRNFLEYGGAREVSISASCPEAGRLIFGKREKITFVEREVPGELDFEESEEELALAEKILYARNRAVEILQNREVSVEERIVSFLHYAEEVQRCLNEEREDEIPAAEASSYMPGEERWGGIGKSKDSASQCYSYFLQRMRSFTAIASINEEWEMYLQRLQERYIRPENGAIRYEADAIRLKKEIEEQEREYEYEHLMVYYAFMCLPRCVDDYDFLGKAKFITASYLMIRDMDMVCMAENNGVFTAQDRQKIARIYAKEVEHSEENLDYLAEECLFEEAYELCNLCKSVLI